MLKSLFRVTSQKVFRGKDEHQKKQYVKQYLHHARMLEARVTELIKHPPFGAGSEELIIAIIEMLNNYKNYVTKFTDQIERRLIKGEVIPAEESALGGPFLKNIPNG